MTGERPESSHAALRLATCPLCYTTDTPAAIGPAAAGAGWQCVRCGQPWTDARIATVAAYAAWASGHDRPPLEVN